MSVRLEGKELADAIGNETRFDKAANRVVYNFFWALGVTFGRYWRDPLLVPVVWGTVIFFALLAAYRLWRKR